jgi:type IV fimbrial biogenesis protein FimT
MRINQGFTLLELMVTVAIAGVMMSFVVPGFVGLIERNVVATTSNEILGALLLARSEAVRLERDVTFTPGTDGWVVTEPDERYPDDTALTFNVVDQTVDNENITIAENIDGGIEVTYNSFGRAEITVGDSIDISFDGTLKSRICLSLTGRPYIKSAAEGNCP